MFNTIEYAFERRRRDYWVSKLCIIELPQDAQIVQILNKKHEYKADKIIVTRIYNLLIKEVSMNMLTTFGVNVYAGILSFASGRGQIDIVKWILDNHKSLRKEALYDPLLSAVKGGSVDVVKLLLDQGIDVHYDDDDEALSSASYYGHIEVVRLLLNRGAIAKYNYSLLWTSMNGYTDIVRLLLEHGADVNFHEPLVSASIHGHTDIVRILLQNGADVHVLSEGPLRMAVSKGHCDIVRLLIEYGANIHHSDDEALFDASNLGYIDIVRLLLKHGADVHSSFGSSALIRATIHGHIDIVRLLLEHGANKYTQAREYTPTVEIADLLDLYMSRKSASYMKLCKTAVDVWGQSTCPVCLEELNIQDIHLFMTKCLHLYHKECARSVKCPICRSKLEEINC